MALTFPPIAPAFLRMFGTRASVIWENPCMGLFNIVVPLGNLDEEIKFLIPTQPLPFPESREVITEIETPLIIPTIPESDRCTEPPFCLHYQKTQKRTVFRKDSPNVGRSFFVCAQSQRCEFFRWADELDQYSTLRLRSTMTADDVKRETKDVDPEFQLAAWAEEEFFF